MNSLAVAIRIKNSNSLSDGTCTVDAEKDVVHLTKYKKNCFQHSSENVHSFSFDHCFGPNASQTQIFESLRHRVTESFASDRNSCIIAYGQTGSGKTFTMLGTEEEPGIIPQLCQVILDSRITSNGETYLASFYEVYNEKVRDLLNCVPPCDGRNVRVREHPIFGPYVSGLCWRPVHCFEDIRHFIRIGCKSRCSSLTLAHTSSSRSHAIFTVVKKRDTVGSDVFGTKIHLVDLAGSEKPANQFSRKQMEEGAHINKSLATLGNVILNLSTDHKLSMQYIPYRNSTLTWLLKDSIGGAARTTMIGTISPDSSCYSETLNTLRFVHKARSITCRSHFTNHRYEKMNGNMISDLRSEIERLHKFIHEQRLKMKINSQKNKLVSRSSMTSPIESKYQNADSFPETDSDESDGASPKQHPLSDNRHVASPNWTTPAKFLDHVTVGVLRYINDGLVGNDSPENSHPEIVPNTNKLNGRLFSSDPHLLNGHYDISYSNANDADNEEQEVIYESDFIDEDSLSFSPGSPKIKQIADNVHVNRADEDFERQVLQSSPSFENSRDGDPFVLTSSWIPVDMPKRNFAKSVPISSKNMSVKNQNLSESMYPKSLHIPGRPRFTFLKKSDPSTLNEAGKNELNWSTTRLTNGKPVESKFKSKLLNGSKFKDNKNSQDKVGNGFVGQESAKIPVATSTVGNAPFIEYGVMLSEFEKSQSLSIQNPFHFHTEDVLNFEQVEKFAMAKQEIYLSSLTDKLAGAYAAECLDSAVRSVTNSNDTSVSEAKFVKNCLKDDSNSRSQPESPRRIDDLHVTQNHTDPGDDSDPGHSFNAVSFDGLNTSSATAYGSSFSSQSILNKDNDHFSPTNFWRQTLKLNVNNDGINGQDGESNSSGDDSMAPRNNERSRSTKKVVRARAELRRLQHRSNSSSGSEHESSNRANANNLINHESSATIEGRKYVYDINMPSDMASFNGDSIDAESDKERNNGRSNLLNSNVFHSSFTSKVSDSESESVVEEVFGGGGVSTGAIEVDDAAEYSDFDDLIDRSSKNIGALVLERRLSKSSSIEAQPFDLKKLLRDDTVLGDVETISKTRSNLDEDVDFWIDENNSSPFVSEKSQPKYFGLGEGELSETSDPESMRLKLPKIFQRHHETTTETTVSDPRHPEQRTSENNFELSGAEANPVVLNSPSKEALIIHVSLIQREKGTLGEIGEAESDVRWGNTEPKELAITQSKFAENQAKSSNLPKDASFSFSQKVVKSSDIVHDTDLKYRLNKSLNEITDANAVNVTTNQPKGVIINQPNIVDDSGLKPKTQEPSHSKSTTPSFSSDFESEATVNEVSPEHRKSTKLTTGTLNVYTLKQTSTGLYPLVLFDRNAHWNNMFNERAKILDASNDKEVGIIDNNTADKHDESTSWGFTKNQPDLRLARQKFFEPLVVADVDDLKDGKQISNQLILNDKPLQPMSKFGGVGQLGTSPVVKSESLGSMRVHPKLFSSLDKELYESCSDSDHTSDKYSIKSKNASGEIKNTTVEAYNKNLNTFLPIQLDAAIDAERKHENSTVDYTKGINIQTRQNFFKEKKLDEIFPDIDGKAHGSLELTKQKHDTAGTKSMEKIENSLEDEEGEEAEDSKSWKERFPGAKKKKTTDVHNAYINNLQQVIPISLISGSPNSRQNGSSFHPATVNKLAITDSNLVDYVNTLETLLPVKIGSFDEDQLKEFQLAQSKVSSEKKPVANGTVSRRDFVERADELLKEYEDDKIIVSIPAIQKTTGDSSQEAFAKKSDSLEMNLEEAAVVDSNSWKERYPGAKKTKTPRANTGAHDTYMNNLQGVIPIALNSNTASSTLKSYDSQPRTVNQLLITDSNLVDYMNTLQTFLPIKIGSMEQTQASEPQHIMAKKAVANGTILRNDFIKIVEKFDDVNLKENGEDSELVSIAAKGEKCLDSSRHETGEKSGSIESNLDDLTNVWKQRYPGAQVHQTKIKGPTSTVYNAYITNVRNVIPGILTNNVPDARLSSSFPSTSSHPQPASKLSVTDSNLTDYMNTLQTFLPVQIGEQASKESEPSRTRKTQDYNSVANGNIPRTGFSEYNKGFPTDSSDTTFSSTSKEQLNSHSNTRNAESSKISHPNQPNPNDSFDSSVSTADLTKDLFNHKDGHSEEENTKGNKYNHNPFVFSGTCANIISGNKSKDNRFTAFEKSENDVINVILSDGEPQIEIDFDAQAKGDHFDDEITISVNSDDETDEVINKKQGDNDDDGSNRSSSYDDLVPTHIDLDKDDMHTADLLWYSDKNGENVFDPTPNLSRSYPPSIAYDYNPFSRSYESNPFYTKNDFDKSNVSQTSSLSRDSLKLDFKDFIDTKDSAGFSTDDDDIDGQNKKSVSWSDIRRGMPLELGPGSHHLSPLKPIIKRSSLTSDADSSFNFNQLDPNFNKLKDSVMVAKSAMNLSEDHFREAWVQTDPVPIMTRSVSTATMQTSTFNERGPSPTPSISMEKLKKYQTMSLIDDLISLVQERDSLLQNMDAELPSYQHQGRTFVSQTDRNSVNSQWWKLWRVKHDLDERIDVIFSELKSHQLGDISVEHIKWLNVPHSALLTRERVGHIHGSHRSPQCQKLHLTPFEYERKLADLRRSLVSTAKDVKGIAGAIPSPFEPGYPNRTRFDATANWINTLGAYSNPTPFEDPLLSVLHEAQQVRKLTNSVLMETKESLSSSYKSSVNLSGTKKLFNESPFFLDRSPEDQKIDNEIQLLRNQYRLSQSLGESKFIKF